ncbi:molecular chaperone [Pseudidiomarina sp. 1APP75-32.1]|uniref:Molecular chaperone n=1 Tax=Pseudidiomarina terrestris TaxID=2820060 RepID=A0AAW7R161_9GAMM|nr:MULTISPECIES: fimbria/pilus periplasmic chaperone [unclassified Pseudidiomarina]MDN7124531.1 molecular chaperone [Pseudidiomarina sp. 1APP75-32.1]MDN7129178.1 molecular chaperone [Pseudidiomarina sp. 1APR75-15]
MSLLNLTKGREKQASNSSLPFYKRFKISIFITLLTLVGCSAVQANTLGVSPVRVELSAAAPLASITVTNSSDQAKTIQLSLFEWRQQGQETSLTATKELIAAPPIAEIPPHQTQIVRVGLRAQPDAQTEKSYRLMIRELPPQDNVGIAITLRISIPVFVAPEQAAAHQLQWRLETRDNATFLIAQNTGTAHAKINELEVEQPVLAQSAPTGNIYVLPGSYYEWQLQDSVSQYPEIVVQARIHDDSVSTTLSTQ